MDEKKEAPMKTIGWRVTSEEAKLLDRLCEALERATVSDLLRYLVKQEAKKIWPK